MINKNSKQRSFFDLKIPEKEKFAKDNEWFKDYMRYIVPVNDAVVGDYESMKLSYEVANNNLEGFKDKLDKFCNPLGENIGEIEEEMVPYPELHNKINVIKGEVLKRNDEHKIILLTAKAIKDKNDALFNAIKASVDEKLAIELEKHKLEMQGMDKKKMDEYVKSLRTQLEPEDLLQKNWQSEIEIFYSKALKYCMYDQDIKMKKMDTMEDIIIADRCFIYSGWKFGKPHLEVRNPLYCGFHKNPNERFVHKGDWFWYKKAVTPADIVNTYDLSDEDMTNLGLYFYPTSSALDKRHDIFGNDGKPVFDHNMQDIMLSTNRRSTYDKSLGLNTGSANTVQGRTHLIWETHFEFKAFKELIFLSYNDEYNQEVKMILPGTFEIPEDATKETFTNNFGDKTTRYVWFDKVSETQYSAEKIWIPRKYEVVRLGTNVYPVCREVPFQSTNIEQPYSSFELSTKGALFNARNSRSVSLLQRALAPYFQYIFIKHIQNRELSKYQGAIQDIDLDQIPDSLGQDIHGNQIRDKVSTYLTYLKRTNKSFYSGSQNSFGGLPPATRSPGSSGFQLGTAVELMNLQNLLEYVKREIGMAMGISPQREASFDNNSNVSDNRQAISQSHYITEPYFFLHSEIWKTVFNDWLINFRTYCENVFENNPNLKEHSIHYYLPDGTEELLKVTPNNLSHTDIGLFLSTGGQTVQYTEYMLQQIQGFSQNAGKGVSVISALLKDITSGASPEEIHKRIQMEEAKQNQREQEMQNMQSQAQERQLQMEIDAREDVQQHELDLVKVKAAEDRITKVQTATISALGFDTEKDRDNDGVPDVIELMDHSLKERQLDLKEKEFVHNKEIDKEKLVIDAKKIKAAKAVKK
jgi:hypothetical protein